MTATPKMGQLVRLTGRNHNGKLEHMGLVTFVYPSGNVNVLMIPDGCAPYAVQDVRWNAKQVAATSDGELVAYPHEAEEEVSEKVSSEAVDTVSKEAVPEKTNKTPQKPDNNKKTGVNKTVPKKGNSTPAEEEDGDTDSEE